MANIRTAAGPALAALLAGSAVLAGAAQARTSPASGEVQGYAAKCADDRGNSTAPGTRVQVWSCLGDAAQQWSFVSGELRHDGMCMNDKAWGGSGSPVILWRCNGAANENWVYHGGTGEYVLKAGGLCLDDPAYSVRNGTGLVVYRCHGGANQRWSLPPTPQSSPPPSPSPSPSSPSPSPSLSSSPAGCHPLTNAGNCYEPGELCRDSDHGATGVSGDGEAIVCEDNDGWRWELA